MPLLQLRNRSRYTISEIIPISTHLFAHPPANHCFFLKGLKAGVFLLGHFAIAVGIDEGEKPFVS